jgi:hypothetical protein
LLKGTAMLSGTANVKKVLARGGACLLVGAALTTSLQTAAETKPLVIRGIPSTAPNELRLAYQATFANGSLDPSVDKLNVGAMVPGDPLIPDTNPTLSFAPGEAVVSVHRPIDLPPEAFPAESLFATPVSFGPGSIVRLRGTFRAPVGPLPGGGFAMGLVARTGGKDDLATETLVGVTVNVRPGFLVRFGASGGNVDPARVVLPDDVKNAIFSSTDPQPFTMDLTIDRVHGTATGKLTVIDQSFTVQFVLSDFLANSGPTITAVGPGIAVNSNAPGGTASVHIRDFRIYTEGGG